MNSITYSEVRAHLADTLKQLEVREEPIFISRRGEPAGVLMSIAQYRRLQGEPVDFYTAYLAWRKDFERDVGAWGSDELVDTFVAVRDPSADGGRPPFEWPQDLLEDADPARSAASTSRSEI